MKKIGIDLVGVIMDRLKFSGMLRLYQGHIPPAKFGEIKEIPGMINVVHGIVNYFGPHNVFVVSKADDVLKEGSRVWFGRNNFFEKTHLPVENVIYCKARKDKAVVCQEKGITQFIDDRREVLHYIYESLPSVKLILFNPDENEPGDFKKHQKHFTIVGESKHLFDRLKENQNSRSV